MIKRQLERPVDVRSVHGLLLPRQPKCQRNCNCRRRVLVLSVHAPVPVLLFRLSSSSLDRWRCRGWQPQPSAPRRIMVETTLQLHRAAAPGQWRGTGVEAMSGLGSGSGCQWAGPGRDAIGNLKGRRPRVACCCDRRSDTGIATGGPARGEPQPTPPGPRPGSLLLNRVLNAQDFRVIMKHAVTDGLGFGSVRDSD